jgi:hypothetical protein
MKSMLVIEEKLLLAICIRCARMRTYEEKQEEMVN